MAGSRRRKHHDRDRAHELGPKPSTSTGASTGATGFVFSNSPIISTNFTGFASASAPAPSSATTTPSLPITTAAPTTFAQGQTKKTFSLSPAITTATAGPTQFPQTTAPAALAINFAPPPIVTIPSGPKSASILRPASGPNFSLFIEPTNLDSSFVSDPNSYSGAGSNPVWYVPVSQNPEQRQGFTSPQLSSNPQPIPVSSFRGFPHLPTSIELFAKYEQVRLKLNQSIKNDQLKQRAEEEKRLEAVRKSEVRSYEMPNAETYERIVGNHVLRLQDHFRAKLLQTRTVEERNALLTGRERSGNARFVLNGLEKYANFDPGARHRILRHRNLINSMDERMAHHVKVQGQESSSPGENPRRKTNWARLDKSVLKELLEKRGRAETQSEGDSPVPASSTQNQNQARVAGVILKSPLYYCKPSLSQLDELTDQSTGSCRVRDFEVGHQIYGKIVFPGEINVAGLDLDQIVSFRLGKVQLYFGDQRLPPFGRGLHHPFVATMYNMYPRLENWKPDAPVAAAGDDGAQELQERTTSKAEDMIGKYTRVLQQACARFGGEFIGYDYNTAAWAFKISRLDSQ